MSRLIADYKKTALIIRLIIATGIRTSELPKVTVQAVKQGYVEVAFINSMRRVALPNDIREQLLQYAYTQHITDGAVFLTLQGHPCGKNAMFRAFGRLATAVGIAPERLTGEALRKYYNDKHIKENSVPAVQASMGYSGVNYYVEYEPQEDEVLMQKLNEMFE
ncbi:MAG: site-specific integrase [Defluviitaleaceae bacterium]|nr:site-specific integrase [Defluviitaleaceae bacterium]MCL2276174.1 site-specific integrase [Defluviitaleaceae bacterium]